MVCVINGTIVGFAIVSVKDSNVWALFTHPTFEQRGIARQLHNMMLNWYFGQTQNTIWLSTSSATRAANFYNKAGWKEVGTYGKGELKFEISYDSWIKAKHSA